MKFIPFLVERKIFPLTIFIMLIYSSFSDLSFKYPYAFKLYNKKIFVIHQLGITICNNFFTEGTNILIFSESEKIKTNEALSKVTSVFANDYIICLINDYAYIFNKEGTYLKKNDTKITQLNVEYYSLTFAFEESNCLYFVIGFINSKKIYLSSYKYKITDNSIGYHISIANNNFDTSIGTNIGFSCHYMQRKNILNPNQNVLACVYSKFVIGFKIYLYEIKSTSFTKIDAKEPPSLIYESKYIKSIVLQDKENIIISVITKEGILFHYKYNINDNNIGNWLKYYSGTYCKFIPHGLQIIISKKKTRLLILAFFQVIIGLYLMQIFLFQLLVKIMFRKIIHINMIIVM